MGSRQLYDWVDGKVVGLKAVYLVVCAVCVCLSLSLCDLTYHFARARTPPPSADVGRCLPSCRGRAVLV